MINGINAYYNTNYSIGFSGYSGYTIGAGRNVSDAQLDAMKRAGAVECSTCASRKYVDGSNEMNVSFKSPGHISPQASAGMVKAHEMQHVGNAYSKASKDNGKVLQATVSLDYSRCPECGRSYVSGGETVTAIKYQKGNPYSANAKAYDAANGAIGGNVDIAV